MRVVRTTQCPSNSCMFAVYAASSARRRPSAGRRWVGLLVDNPGPKGRWEAIKRNKIADSGNVVQDRD